jgi:hypothetical protein
VLLSVLFLGESVTWLHILGGVFVTSGMVIAMRTRHDELAAELAAKEKALLEGTKPAQPECELPEPTSSPNFYRISSEPTNTAADASHSHLIPAGSDSSEPHPSACAPATSEPSPDLSRPPLRWATSEVPPTSFKGTPTTPVLSEPSPSTRPAHQQPALEPLSLAH